MCVSILAVVAFALLGCTKKSDVPQQPVTQTIAPAAAQPAANGTDAMTGTVEVEENRSENEGGVLTDTPSTKTSEPAVRKTPAPKKTTKSSKKP